MLIAAVIVLVAVALALPLLVRPGSLPAPEPPSPTRHLEDKRDTIYENLRDLQGEYLMGKLSDEDYQQTKRDLQRELAEVMTEIDRVLQGEPETERAQPAETNRGIEEGMA